MRDTNLDMRKVEAKAFLQQIERRDPLCVFLLIGALDRFIQAYPQLKVKDLLAMVHALLPTAGLNKKEKEFLCPNLSESSTEESLSQDEADIRTASG